MLSLNVSWVNKLRFWILSEPYTVGRWNDITSQQLMIKNIRTKRIISETKGHHLVSVVGRTGRVIGYVVGVKVIAKGIKCIGTF